MPSNIDDLELDAPPHTIDPYAELGVDKAAAPDQIKSAYRRAALKHHPDKVAESDKAAAHTKFQAIALAYAVLSDPRRRALYDATGRTESSLDLDADGDEGVFDWGEYYRAQFAEAISAAAIEEFAREYKGSDEEREALLTAYVECGGDMDGVYERVMTSDPAADDERFRGIINTAIELGEVEGLPAYTGETQKSKKERIKQAKKESTEAEAHAKELGVYDKLFGSEKTGGKGGKGGDGEAGLAALIQQRQKGRADDLIAHLEAKYAPKKRKRGGDGDGKAGKRGAEKAGEDGPSEEAFEEMERAGRASRAKKGRSTK